MCPNDICMTWSLVAVVQRVLLSLSVQHWTDWCLSEPMYSPNPWHDFPWGPVCSVCPVVACSFQLSECSTDIPESSGSPPTPPWHWGTWAKKQPQPTGPRGNVVSLRYGRKTKDPSFECRVIQLQMILPRQSSCSWQKSFEHPLGACFFPVFQAWLWACVGHSECAQSPGRCGQGINPELCPFCLLSCTVCGSWGVYIP